MRLATCLAGFDEILTLQSGAFQQAPFRFRGPFNTAGNALSNSISRANHTQIQTLIH
jgi:hypothetical protein